MRWGWGGKGREKPGRGKKEKKRGKENTIKVLWDIPLETTGPWCWSSLRSVMTAVWGQTCRPSQRMPPIDSPSACVCSACFPGQKSGKCKGSNHEVCGDPHLYKEQGTPSGWSKACSSLLEFKSQANRQWSPRGGGQASTVLEDSFVNWAGWRQLDRNWELRWAKVKRIMNSYWIPSTYHCATHQIGVNTLSTNNNPEFSRSCPFQRCRNGFRDEMTCPRSHRQCCSLESHADLCVPKPTCFRPNTLGSHAECPLRILTVYSGWSMGVG